jgi:exonuclease III
VTRTVLAALALTALAVSGSSSAEAPVKIAFYNIRSGQGVQPLRGRTASFANVANCTDTSKPVNAWGTGVVQKTLAGSVGKDPSVVALGLAEAWKNVCASAERVRELLGWKAASSTQNGVALVARYGLHGEQWQQLDTSRNTNPKDTAWVLRASVCLEPQCHDTLTTYIAHWYATGPSQTEIYEAQAKQTIAFMHSTSRGTPHVLIGDLNVWDAPGDVCRQHPNGAAALAAMTSAGYIDAWPRVHGRDEGYTGMVNRIRCGDPEGYAWKRVDYAWSPASYPPVAMTRFGIVPPGEAAPSDHYGIIATYPRP